MKTILFIILFCSLLFAAPAAELSKEETIRLATLSVMAQQALRMISGDGVPRDPVKGAAQLVKVTKQTSYPPHMVVCGHLYRDGIGVAKDKIEAAKWYGLALPDPDAQTWHDLIKATLTPEDKKSLAERIRTAIVIDGVVPAASR